MNAYQYDNLKVADLNQTASDHPQLLRLNALIEAALFAQAKALKGELFTSYEGRALTNAAYDLFECDELYTLRQDIEHDLRIDGEGHPINDQGEEVFDTFPRITTPIRQLNPAAWGFDSIEEMERGNG